MVLLHHIMLQLYSELLQSSFNNFILRDLSTLWSAHSDLLAGLCIRAVMGSQPKIFCLSLLRRASLCFVVFFNVFSSSWLDMKL